MAKEFFRTVPGVPAPMGPYSLGVKVTGTLVLLAGQIGTDPETGQLAPGGVEAQVRQTFRNIQRVLEATGSSLDQVVKLTVFLTDMRDLPTVAAVRREFWQGPHPVSTTVQVSQLPHPEAVIEVEAVAIA